MIETRVSVHAGRTEAIGARVIEVGIQAGGGCVLIIGGSAHGQHFPVGQDRGIHLDPRLRHRRSVLPLERGR